MAHYDEFKILDDKIEANQAQQNLHRESAKIYALSSGELEKYEYLTGEGLGNKLGVNEQAKFEYSPMSKVFNKGLEEDKKEEILKRLKKIKEKNEEKSEAIKKQKKGKQSKN